MQSAQCRAARENPTGAIVSRQRFAAAALFALAISSHFSQPKVEAQAGEPKLLVILVVDQMRADYLTRFDGVWKRGIRRLLSEGAVFEQARFPYLNTVTCVGHATISTGSFPATHGIILNEWLQRGAGRRMSCTEDPTVTPLPFDGPPEKIGHSAHRLRVPTLGDRLRERSPASRVVTLSMKPRSAVMLAGQTGTVAWFSDANSWSTSTAFAKSLPPVLTSYFGAHPVEAARSSVWDRVLEPPSYKGPDDGVGERPGTGWSTVFPHPLSGAPGTPATAFYDLWERSPYSDAYLGGMAGALVEGLNLGRQGSVDLLGISFSALDYAGHSFGPASHEVQDTLARLDIVIGDLFDLLDARVGRGRYVVALSADHGVAPIPEQRQKAGKDAGRLLPQSVRAVAEKVLQPLGSGPHVDQVEYTDLYLTERSRAALAQHPDLERALLHALGAMPGVARVFTSGNLKAARSSADPIERAAALSHVDGESGEIVLVPRPGWIMTNSSATTHGSSNDYDQRVPVILMGPPHVKPGRYQVAASPADIAPSLAALVSLPMPGVDGRALSEAIVKER